MKFLSSVSLFFQISQNRLKNKLHLFKEEFYSINSIIYKETEPVEFAYILVSGEVEVIF